MRSWWDHKAAQLFERGVAREQKVWVEYQPEDVNQAIIHARQDTILLVSYMSSANKQLQMGTLLLLGILGTLLWIAYHLHS
jgi:hypothetical protein